MKKVILPPIKERPQDYDDLEDIISMLFKDEIYKPLMDEVAFEHSKILRNATGGFLLKKISDGTISFYRGTFSGKFSAKSTIELRKIGAKWDSKTKTFKMQMQKLPPDISKAIKVSGSKFDRIVANIKKRLSKMLPEKIAERLNAKNLFDKSLYQTDRDIQKTLKGITVSPKLTDKERLKIATEYNLNMQRYIKGWTEKEIINLREMIEKESIAGQRFENLVKIIEKRYDVGKSKAKFLARQETGLMMSKFKEARYVDAGSEGYIWKTVAGSAKSPVRPMHKALDGKYIRWDDPPITNPQGDRNHAGEDYN